MRRSLGQKLLLAGCVGGAQGVLVGGAYKILGWGWQLAVAFVAIGLLRVLSNVEGRNEERDAWL